MKRGLLVILAILFLFAILSVDVYAVQTTGGAVQTVGKVTSAQINASIYIENAPPVINYLVPKENRTYRNSSTWLNYSVYDPEGISLVWYNLDNTANISLGNFESGFVRFNSQEGNHTLYFYVNDSAGSLNFSIVPFFVNNTKIIGIYETFRTGKGGDTTDFDSLDDVQLENLSNMTLENTDYGKIVWIDAINITNDSSPGNRVTIIDDNVLIGDSFIFVDRADLPNLNKRATLWFYNINFSNPRVLRDGVVCPTSVCSNKQYSSETLRVDVENFSNYSVQETPEESPGVAPSGGGGGGGRFREETAEKNFSLDKEDIMVSLKQGETKADSIVIINNEISEITINLVPSGIEDFLKVNEREFILGAGETKSIRLDFIAPEDKQPNFYVGRLSVRSGSTKKDVLIAIEIESKEPLFDLSVEILKSSQSVFPGESVAAFIKVYSFGGTSGRVDAILEYSLVDETGKLIILGHETIAVETQVSFIKEMEVPISAESGNYFVYVKVAYHNQSASSSAKFFVKKESFFQTGTFTYALLISILVLLVAIFVMIYLGMKSKSKAKKEKIIDEYLLVTKNQIKIKEDKKRIKSKKKE